MLSVTSRDSREVGEIDEERSGRRRGGSEEHRLGIWGEEISGWSYPSGNGPDYTCNTLKKHVLTGENCSVGRQR